MNLETKLRTEINGILSTVVNTFDQKEEILNRPELTNPEKNQRLKALRDRRKEKIREKKNKIKRWLLDNQINEDKITEQEPESSKEVQKALRWQNRAGQRLDGLDDKPEIVSAVKSTLKDETVPEGYKREMFRLGKTQLQAEGASDDDYSLQQMKRLRRKHLLDEKTVGKLRKSDAIEDLKPKVNFAMNYLDNHLDNYVFANDRNPAKPTGKEDAKEKLKGVLDPALDDIGETIEEHKPNQS